MFKKTKKRKATVKSNQLSPELQKANELRKAVLSSQKKCEKIIERHSRELEGVKDQKRRSEIDKKYGVALLRAEHDADAIYANYSTHMSRNFSEDELWEAGAKYGQFLDKKFINNLDKIIKKSTVQNQKQSKSGGKKK